MKWAIIIINYDSKSEIFWEPGDSGSAIADIRGCIGGMLTGGCGKINPFDESMVEPSRESDLKLELEGLGFVEGARCGLGRATEHR